MKVLFTGGGTLGPVTPLLAVAEELTKGNVVRPFKVAQARLKPRTTSDIELCWIGTRTGPERKLVENADIPFSWIWAPKWRRYFDLRNLFVPLALLIATKISWFKLLRLRPDVIVTAGGYVGVPMVWAGWLLRIPCVLHNQDVRWSLANKLVAPFVKKITYALPGTVPRWRKNKSVWTGNPVRSFVLTGNKERGLKLCEFTESIPTIMVVGGGTGAQCLNEVIREALPELTKQYQMIHVTGKGKGDASNFALQNLEVSPFSKRYRAFEFVTTEMGELLAAADLVITRAGMGFLTELAALGKPMIIVPIPKSHQEGNARYFAARKAAILLDQRVLSAKTFIKAVDDLFDELGIMRQMSECVQEFSKPDAARQVAQEVMGLAKK